jgi:apolipoprotein N-acyltransferase
VPLVDEAAAASGLLLSGASLDGPDPATERLIAALVFEDGFEEVDRYVKRRLVPFGEFVPLRPLLDWFPPLEQIPRDAVPGEGPQAVTVAPGIEAASSSASRPCSATSCAATCSPARTPRRSCSA